MLLRGEEERYGYGLVLPAILILGILVGYPILYSLFLAMSDKQVGSPAHFTGLKNFVELVQTDVFRTTVFNSLVFTVSAVSIKTVLGLLLAVNLYHIWRGRKIFRGLILIPWAIPISLGAIAWWWMFDPLYSVINWTFVRLGLFEKGIAWTYSPFYARIAIILVNVWRGLPFLNGRDRMSNPLRCFNRYDGDDKV